MTTQISKRVNQFTQPRRIFLQCNHKRCTLQMLIRKVQQSSHALSDHKGLCSTPNDVQRPFLSGQRKDNAVPGGRGALARSDAQGFGVWKGGTGGARVREERRENFESCGRRCGACRTRRRGRRSLRRSLQLCRGLGVMADGDVVRRIGARVRGKWVLVRMTIGVVRNRTREGGRRGGGGNVDRGWRSALLEWISRNA